MAHTPDLTIALNCKWENIPRIQGAISQKKR